MILTPVTVTATATALATGVQTSKVKALVLHNEAGGNPVALKFDGGATALTFVNGIPLEVGETMVIEELKGQHHNTVQAICDTGLTSTVRIHGIE